MQIRTDCTLVCDRFPGKSVAIMYKVAYFMSFLIIYGANIPKTHMRRRNFNRKLIMCNINSDVHSVLDDLLVLFLNS